MAFARTTWEDGPEQPPNRWGVGDIGIVPAEGGEPRDVTAAFDRPFGDHALGDLLGHGEAAPELVWSPDVEAIYCLVSDAGRVHLVLVEVRPGQVRPVTRGEGGLYPFSFSRAGSGPLSAIATCRPAGTSTYSSRHQGLKTVPRCPPSCGSTADRW